MVLPDIEEYAPKGKQPAGGGRGLGRDRVPEVRWRGPARDRHDGHLRRLLLVLPPLPRSPQRRRPPGTRRGRLLDARRPVHRRRRARDPAPDVRALLRQGARRHGSARGAGAVRQPLHPGDDHPRRGEDVQVARQHGQPGRVRRALRRRHRPDLRLLHGPAERAATGPTRGSRASTASSRGSGASAARSRSGPRRESPAGPRRATRASCSPRPTGRSTRSPATSSAASSSTPRSPR